MHARASEGLKCVAYTGRSGASTGRHGGLTQRGVHGDVSPTGTFVWRKDREGEPTHGA